MIWLVILNIWNGWYHPPVAKEPTYKLWDTYLHVLVCICCRTETETLSNNQNWFLLDQDYRKYRHTGYNFQEESRKNILSLSLFYFWINMQEEYILTDSEWVSSQLVDSTADYSLITHLLTAAAGERRSLQCLGTKSTRSCTQAVNLATAMTRGFWQLFPCSSSLEFSFLWVFLVETFASCEFSFFSIYLSSW